MIKLIREIRYQLNFIFFVNTLLSAPDLAFYISTPSPSKEDNTFEKKAPGIPLKKIVQNYTTHKYKERTDLQENLKQKDLLIYYVLFMNNYQL